MKFLLIAGIAFIFSNEVTAKFQYVSPSPGAKMITVDHNIIIREGSLLDAGSINKDLFRIHGTKSGEHYFSLVLSSDGKTIVLTPSKSFSHDEVISVNIIRGLKTQEGRVVNDYSFGFSTHREYSSKEKKHLSEITKLVLLEELEQNGLVPGMEEVHPRSILTGSFNILVNNTPSPGEIFFDSWNGDVWGSEYDGYHIITTNGDSVYSSPGEETVLFEWDLNPNGYLSYWNDAYPRFDILDSNYNLIDFYYPANGYIANIHEFTMYENGHVFLIGEEYQIIDMTVYDPTYCDSTFVAGTVIQEFDADRNLIFEWRSFDHVEITECNQQLFYCYIDYMHTNSIEIDLDGNILASHRHLNQITKIDRATGEFIWRLGGKMNEFDFVNDEEQFNFQHDARRLPNGSLTLWDNGNKHDVAHSTAKEYRMDEDSLTVELVWSYSPINPGTGTNVYFFGMGNVQRLDNGNTFINGGWDYSDTQSNMWEVTPSGEVVWELALNNDANLVGYRAHKYNWKPCAPVFQASIEPGAVTSNSAELQWKPVSNAVSYEVQFKRIEDNDWNSRNSENEKIILINLIAEKIYEYRVRAVCANGHASDWSVLDSISTASGSLFPAEGIFRATLYPNPANEELFVEWHDNAEEIISISIYDISGKLFLSSRVNNSEELHHIQLDISFLPAGMYLAKVSSERATEVMKFLAN